MDIKDEYARAVAALQAAGYTPADPLKLGLDEARQTQHRYFACLNQDLPAVAGTRDFEVAGPVGPIGLRMHVPGTAAHSSVIVFVRGAGWWAGNLDSHERTARLCAIHSGCAVLQVDYRRAPEHRYPAQLLELLAVIEAVRGGAAGAAIDPSKLVLWGESAGATLSVLAAMRLRDAGQPLPAALVLFYGNFGGPNETMRAQSKWVWQQYLGPAFEQPPAGAIPVRQNAAGLPASWLGCGDADPLLADTHAMRARLAQAGVRHQLRVYPGLPHAFANLHRVFEGAAGAIRDAAAFVRAELEPTLRTTRP